MDCGAKPRFSVWPGAAFSERLIAWQKQHGRHGLPWQASRDPYRIWVAEIMLQQTQVSTVIPYYLRFLARFPDVGALAAADSGEVMAHWSGLGYYARGRNLHRAAQVIVRERGGAFPASAREVALLPGVGRSTAAAIAAFAYGERAAILDGNVRRVLARCFAVAGPAAEAEKSLWQLAEALLPEREIASYTQGLMDLGATVCTRSRPRCSACPMAEHCVARREDRVADLPVPRRPGAQPMREAVLFVVRHGSRVLLETRPNLGIWGGLMSLPEAQRPAAQCSREIEARFGLTVTAVRRLPDFIHAFTHFRLRIHPLLCAVGRPAATAEMPGRRWCDLGDLSGLALPAPIRRLLEGLRPEPEAAPGDKTEQARRSRRAPAAIPPGRAGRDRRG